MIQKIVLFGVLLASPLAFYPLLRDSTPTPYDVPVDNAAPRDKVEKLSNEELVKAKPVEFLEYCLAEYDKKVTHGYRCHFVKQECVQGNLRDPEKLVVNFRAKPFSVHMVWLEGAEFCVKSMYVEGENGGKLLAASAFNGVPLGVTLARPIDAPDAKATSRFPITQFGIKAGMISTIRSMKAAYEKGTLNITYAGIEKLAKVGDRPCYKLVRIAVRPTGTRPHQQAHHLDRLRHAHASWLGTDRRRRQPHRRILLPRHRAESHLRRKAIHTQGALKGARGGASKCRMLAPRAQVTSIHAQTGWQNPCCLPDARRMRPCLASPPSWNYSALGR